MSQKIKQATKILFPFLCFSVLLFIGLKTAHAQSSLGNWDFFLKQRGVTGIGDTGLSGEDLTENLVRRGIRLVKYLIGGVATIMGIIYASQLIFARGNEEGIGKAKKNFLWVLLGFAILMGADSVADVFSPQKATSDQLIDFTAANDRLREITSYLKYLFGSIMGLLITISGIRLVTNAGNEEEVTKQRRNLIWSGLGMLVILLASNIVNAIYVVENTTGTVKVAEASAGITEIVSLIQLGLVFLGPVAVLFTIVAGFRYLTALDNEDQAGKAKKAIIGGITGIIVIYSAFALINTLVGDRGSLSEALNCGNGIVEGIEQCDDGNLISGDGCSQDCTAE